MARCAYRESDTRIGRREFGPRHCCQLVGKHRRVRSILLTTVLLLVVVAQVGQAQALTVATAAVTFPTVTLDGTVQTVSGSTSAWRLDATTETGGWSLTVTSTDLTDGGVPLRTIPVSNLTTRLLNADIAVVSGDPAGPASTQTTFVSLSGTPLKLASAGVGDGDGIYDLTPGFELTVPADTYIANYSATVTIDIAIGP